MCNTWLAVEKHLVYLAQDRLKQGFGFASFCGLWAMNVCWVLGVFGRKKTRFSKRFIMAVLFLISL